MNFLVRCYLDDYLKTQARSSLHDRRKRKECVEYLTTLIEGFTRGRECNLEQACSDAIQEIIAYHRENSSKNGSVCLMGKYHNVLYLAVRLAFDFELINTNVIVQLLMEVYKCERTFERIQIGAIFGNCAPHYIAGWKSDFDSEEQNQQAVNFYLRHATTSKLSLDKIRYVDVPIESCAKCTVVKLCVNLGLPDKLLIVLRFGGELGQVDSLFRQLMERLKQFLHCYPYNLVACLQILVRVVPKVPLDKKELEEYQELIEDGLVPVSRLGGVVELKHLSRCKIRTILNGNYELPFGIRKLALPENLKNYLDLLDD